MVISFKDSGSNEEEYRNIASKRKSKSKNRFELSLRKIHDFDYPKIGILCTRQERWEDRIKQIERKRRMKENIKVEGETKGVKG